MAPTDAGGGTEISGGSYERKVVIFSETSDGTVENITEVLFSKATEDWGIIEAFGIFDSQAIGNLLYQGSVSPAKEVLEGNVVRFETGDLTISED